MLALLANVAAAFAVLAGRDREARRWLRVAEAEATADGLDGGEVLVAWLGAVKMVARSMDPGSADGVLGP